MTEFPLSRTLDPKDYTRLSAELREVDKHSLAGQHPHRRWEYALALKAVTRWGGQTLGGAPNPPLYDVGGAGSPFHQMLASWTDTQVVIIDPAEEGSGPLDTWVHGGTPLADVITCISVIEHVPDLSAFVYQLNCLLAPGGLLVLTMDYWDKCGKDTAKFAELRYRIFCPKTYGSLRLRCAALDLHPFGGFDGKYHGAQVHDYTFASLVLEKRR